MKQRSYSAESVSPEAAIHQHWRQIRHDLLELRRFKKGWNGFGAAAPDPMVIDTAIEFLKVLRLEGPPPDRVVLSPDGAVIMEWQTAYERREVEISDRSRAEWMWSRPGHRTIHFEQNLNLLSCATNEDEIVDEVEGGHWQRQADSEADGAVFVPAL